MRAATEKRQQTTGRRRRGFFIVRIGWLIWLEISRDLTVVLGYGIVALRCFWPGAGTKFSLNHDLPARSRKYPQKKKSRSRPGHRAKPEVLRVSAWPGEWKVCSFVKGADSFDTVLSSSITIVYERRPASKYKRVTMDSPSAEGSPSCGWLRIPRIPNCAVTILRFLKTNASLASFPIVSAEALYPLLNESPKGLALRGP